MTQALFGGGDNGQAKALKAQQRRQLADLARQQAETDQASAKKTGRKTGSQLLTFLSGEGIDTLGGA